MACVSLGQGHYFEIQAEVPDLAEQTLLHDAGTMSEAAAGLMIMDLS